MGSIFDFLKKTWDENQAGYARIEAEKKKIKRKKQCDANINKNSLWPFDNSVNIADMSRAEQHERELKIQVAMEAYPFLPFAIADSILIRPNASGCELNITDKKIVDLALQELNQLIIDYYSNKNIILQLLPQNITLPYCNIFYGFASPNNTSRLPMTYIEYKPFTNQGNHSKTPLTVHYTTIKSRSKYLDNECSGELIYGIDGNVCSAKAFIYKDNHCFSYSFGMVGRTFLITKISTVNYSTGKQVIIYDSLWDFIEY